MQDHRFSPLMVLFDLILTRTLHLLAANGKRVRKCDEKGACTRFGCHRRFCCSNLFSMVVKLSSALQKHSSNTFETSDSWRDRSILSESLTSVVIEVYSIESRRSGVCTVCRQYFSHSESLSRLNKIPSLALLPLHGLRNRSDYDTSVYKLVSVWQTLNTYKKM